MTKYKRVVSLNIRHGGGNRANKLVNWIGSQRPFATVVTEWRDNAPGQQIRDGSLSGELRSFSTARGPKINSVLTAARNFTRTEIVTPPTSPVGDLTLMELDGITIVGCYFPQRMAKVPFFERCFEVATKAQHLPLPMIGDFNTGRNDLDIEANGARFHCADSLGFVTKPVLLTYGVCDTACGVSGLGALPRMGFVLITHSETKHSFRTIDAKSITNLA